MLESDKDRRQDLFEEIVSIARLRESFKAVRINKGAAGVDDITVERFEANLEEEVIKLHTELVNWSYKPKPVRRVEIPKADGSKRKLGIPTVRDRVLQGAIKLVLEPMFDKSFSESSYGFRPGRGQQQAIGAAQKIVASAKEYVVDIDLAQFFDTVNHDRLLHRMRQVIADKRVIRLIGMSLRSGVMEDGLVKATGEGTTQGSPLSPLLSNIVLDELDKELEKRGLEFARFADDCNIFTGSQAAAERVMEKVKSFIESKLKLKINEKKSKVAKSSAVKFLGLTIRPWGIVTLSPQSLKRAMEKVQELIPRGTNQTLEESIKRLNSWYSGWANYFKMTCYPSQLKAVEAHMRRRLRARLVKQQKRPRFLRDKLIKQGLSHQLASATAYSGKGIWAKSHSPGVERAFSNQWFKAKGLKTFSDKKLAHWFEVKVWIKLSEEPCT